MNKLILVILFFLLTASPVLIFSQEKALSNNEIKCAEEYFYGSNDLMVNGRVYVPSNPKANGHPYYLFGNYQIGTLFVRDLVFDHTDLKYNLVTDQLILRKTLPNTTVAEIIVTPSLVDSFIINGALFVNNNSFAGISGGSIYLQKIYQGNVGLYKNLTKHYYPVFSQSNPFGLFGKADKKFYIINSSGAFTEIRSKRDFLNYFSHHKREIRRYLKKQSIRFSQITDHQFFNLIKFCDNLE